MEVLVSLAMLAIGLGLAGFVSNRGWLDNRTENYMRRRSILDDIPEEK